MADLHPDVIRAIRRTGNTALGRRYDRFARRRYGVRGNVLAAKEVSGESGGNMGAVSNAGARGSTQFMPATRAEMIRRHGIDPWKDQTSAIRAMEIYQMEGGRGVEGYNPGDPGYRAYILKQQLDKADVRALRGRSGGAPSGGRGARGTLRLPGRRTTDVSLQSRTIPGQSFQAERDAAAKDLFLSGRPLSVESLLAYKSTVNSLQDVPEQKVLGDIVVRQRRGPDVRVRGGLNSQSRRGRVIVAPTANRAGAPLAPITKRAVGLVAGRLGRPLTIGTGTNHSRMTVDGNVSDHWNGHGADIPLRGRQLIRAGQSALMEFGMSPSEARRQRGGLFNLEWNGRRVQVIFNTQQGGDHTDHLHLGIR